MKSQAIAISGIILANLIALTTIACVGFMIWRDRPKFTKGLTVETACRMVTPGWFDPQCKYTVDPSGVVWQNIGKETK